MVLVDTSVWIRAFANRAPYAAELDRLLRLNEVAGHELVYGELLIGDRGGRRNVLAYYEQIYQAAIVPHHEVVARWKSWSWEARPAVTFLLIEPDDFSLSVSHMTDVTV